MSMKRSWAKNISETEKAFWSKPLSHEQAMQVIYDAMTVSTLSYEEAIAVYLRSRQILNDDPERLGDPVPKDWTP